MDKSFISKDQWNNPCCVAIQTNKQTEMLKKNTNKGENYKKKIENIKFKFYD